MIPPVEIIPRDDGWFDVVSGDTMAGPFPTISFAMRVASGEKPAPIMAGRFHRFRVIREVQHDAS